MRITIIGSGNVATHMAAAFKNAGHSIVQVYSRNFRHASLLAYHVGAEAADKIDQVSADTDIFVIAVKDDLIDQMAKALATFKKLTVHTSGTVGLQTILQYHQPAGVFYPLQTFSKIREVDFSNVPLCIEASNEETTLLLEELALTISKTVYRVNSAQRKVLHLSAVFACNFPNHLFTIAQKILADNGLDFNLIRPLILETAQKVIENLPAEVQTGPAVRNDKKTMDSHLQLLSHDTDLQAMYSSLSQSIIKMEIANSGDN